jgi:ABC-type phosphate transport system auxiliary subunit
MRRTATKTLVRTCHKEIEHRRFNKKHRQASTHVKPQRTAGAAATTKLQHRHQKTEEQVSKNRQALENTKQRGKYKHANMRGRELVTGNEMPHTVSVAH